MEEKELIGKIVNVEDQIRELTRCSRFVGKPKSSLPNLNFNKRHLLLMKIPSDPTLVSSPEVNHPLHNRIVRNIHSFVSLIPPPTKNPQAPAHFGPKLFVSRLFQANHENCGRTQKGQRWKKRMVCSCLYLKISSLCLELLKDGLTPKVVPKPRTLFPK